MSFSTKIKEEISVLAARHCCVCHKHKGNNLEVHHIKPKAQGGQDTLENAILLCFDCHADAGHYFAGHPKGLKLSPKELKEHKLAWIELVKNNNIEVPPVQGISIVCSECNKTSLSPIFTRKDTVYKDVEELKSMDYKLVLDALPPTPIKYKITEPKINSFEDFVDFMNGKHLENLNYSDPFENSSQPVHHSIGMFLQHTSLRNMSVCTANLTLRNNSTEVLEDYKVYISFENITRADTVHKKKSAIDLEDYNYQLKFNTNCSAVFIPNSNVLVQNDFIELDQICFKTKPDVEEIIINWNLVARNYSLKESLILKIIPKIEIEIDEKYVENPDSYKSETTITDKITILR